MSTKIDWSRPIENRYGPCKLLHKLKNDRNSHYVVVTLNEKGQEFCMEYNDEGSTWFTEFALRNVVERKVFFVPFEAQRRCGIVTSKPQTILLLGKPRTSMSDKPDEFEEAFDYALRLTFDDEKPVSAEILALPKDAE